MARRKWGISPMNQTHTESNTDPVTLEPKVVSLDADKGRSQGVLVVGFACALFAVCATFGAASLHPMELGLVGTRFFVDVLIIGCALLWLVALRCFARPFSSPACIMSLLVFAFVGTVLCPILLSTPWWMVGIPGVSGGCVALIFLWWSHACTVGRKSLGLILSEAVIVAAAALVAASFTPDHLLPMDYLRDMAALAACLLLLFVHNDRRDVLLRVSIAESRERRRDRVYSRLGEFNYFTIGVVIGVDGGLWYLMEGGSVAAASVSPILIFGAALLCAAIILMVSYTSRRFDVERVSKDYLTAALACGYLCMPLVHGMGFVVIYGYLVTVIFLQLLIVFMAGAELVRFEQLSPLYSYTEITYTVVGALLGSAVMALVDYLFPVDAVIVGTSAVVLYMTFAQVQLNRVSFPEDWVDENVTGVEEDLAGESSFGPTQPGVLLAQGGSEGAELAVLDDGEAEGATDDKFIPAGSYLRQRLDAVASHYGLSPRQTEILSLLARGRDTYYIMEHFTISRATAKTHVYNIYRKLDIHSRQELFDLLERDDFPES